MQRAKTIQNLYDKKHSEYEFDGVWRDAIGNPDTGGAWLIWGPEKNGKTRVTMLLADYLSGMAKVHYISAEEGTGKDFIAALKWAKISPSNKQLQCEEYEPLPDLKARLRRRKAAKVVIIDNLTFYRDELTAASLKNLLMEYPDVLFIFLAHEERGEPYTAIAKLVRKVAKVIIYVEGMACVVSGRCTGGRLLIDDQRAELYHGHDKLKTTA